MGKLFFIFINILNYYDTDILDNVINCGHQLHGRKKYFLSHEQILHPYQSDHLGDEIFLTSHMNEKDYENSLFYVEVEGQNR